MAVHVDFRNPYTNQSGTAQPIRENDEFANFYFSDPKNPEVFAKVLGNNDPTYFQVFLGALTNFEYTVTFTGCGGQSVTFNKPPYQYAGFADATTLTKSACGGGTRPTAAFSYSPASPVTGQAVQFTNQSSNASSYSWNFGDGATSSSANPAHVFNSPGTYAVSLTAFNSSGSDTTSRTVTVSPLQGGSLSGVNVSADQTTIIDSGTINFTASPVGGTAPFTYSWTFGDGASGGNFASVGHYYSAAGTYSIVCTIRDATTTSKSGSITVTVTPGVPPIAIDFYVNDAVSGTRLQLQTCTGCADFSAIVGQSLTFVPASPSYGSISWTFGDGTSTTVYTPTHIYTTTSTYMVGLTVGSRSKTYTIEIRPP